MIKEIILFIVGSVLYTIFLFWIGTWPMRKLLKENEEEMKKVLRKIEK
jgi:membrane protein DedA with SNARE-associated domain